MTPRRHLTRNLLYLLVSTSLVVTLSLFFHVRPFSSRSKSETQSSYELPAPYLDPPPILPLRTAQIQIDDDDDHHEQQATEEPEPEPEDPEIPELPPPPPAQAIDRVSYQKVKNSDNFEPSTTSNNPTTESREETTTSTTTEESEVLDENDADIFTMDQTDPRLIRYIRQHHLTPPSALQYANMTSYGTHANWYSSYIHDLFKNRKGPKTFIEAGAYDGEIASNSLYLEERGWTGLLVECNPLLLPKLMAKNRKAWIANVCLSPTNTPKMMNFTTLAEWPASAKLGRPLNPTEMNKHGLDWVSNKTWTNYKIPCFPLYSIIKAIGDVSEIDFLSLDVEGAEIDILKGFPFDKLKIKTMVVEVHTFSDEDKTDLRDFMGDQNYELRQQIENDDIYVLETEVDLK